MALGGVKISEESFQALLKSMQALEREEGMEPMSMRGVDQYDEEDEDNGISESFGGEEEKEE